MDKDYHCLTVNNTVVASTKSALASLDERDWLDHVNRACYQGAWQVYPLRGLSRYQESSPILQGFALEESRDEADYVDYPAMSAFPDLADFVAQLSCPVLSVRLMRLLPGANILPHRDHGLCFSQGQARLHLCLTSEPDVEFVVNGESVHMAPGELWYLKAIRDVGFTAVGRGL